MKITLCEEERISSLPSSQFKNRGDPCSPSLQARFSWSATTEDTNQVRVPRPPNRMGRHFVLDFGPELPHKFALRMTTNVVMRGAFEPGAEIGGPQSGVVYLSRTERHAHWRRHRCRVNP